MFESEINLLKKFLAQYNLNTYVINEPDLLFSKYDLGIRKFLGLENDNTNKLNLLFQQINSHTIYQIKDDYFCNYIIMQLPETNPAMHLLIGPYTDEHLENNNILQTIAKFQVPPFLVERAMQYFSSIPYIVETTAITNMVEVFADIIWKGHENYTTKDLSLAVIDSYIGNIPNEILENITEQKDISFQMELLEKRYAAENQFIQNVAQGNFHKVDAALNSSTMFNIENRLADPIRNFKNYCIVLNTLLRKGAELGDVHPIHIDKLSSYFAKKIEQIRSQDQGKKLMQEMVRKYCLLVKNRSLTAYSYLVQKAITRIDADITADQTLNTHAKLLNVSSSYLSTLFRKETGLTLTEYVNRKRIEHGIFLLNTTKLQIQTIAECCGIGDLNYFTRIFKKYIGTTPKEYRKSLNN